MLYAFDRRKTLQELEDKDWGEPSYSSYLVTTAHRLRRKPLKDFTAEDLRILIGQGVGLAYLLPLAIEELERNPLAQGDFYPGDLLVAVLRTPASHWLEDRAAWRRLEEVLANVEEYLATIDGIDREAVREAIGKFRQNAGLCQ